MNEVFCLTLTLLQANGYGLEDQRRANTSGVEGRQTVTVKLLVPATRTGIAIRCALNQLIVAVTPGAELSSL